ncbi:hypothetical protein ACFO4O_08165 [Glaciecola siphonariae]|uniref:Uncharacterized protein n=1 Tax=Glaciecola siphonariae TaxID=521012 RepID=A0ABV9LV06_9ALTE
MQTTVLTSIGMSKTALDEVLSNPDMDNEQHVAVIDELVSKGFIEKVTNRAQ